MNDEQLSMSRLFASMILLGFVGLATVGAGVYTVSPIDVVPDFIPVAGQADDAGVLGAAAMMLYIAHKSGAFQHMDALLTALFKDDEVLDQNDKK